jgi:alpha-tubulin suppressor-like RCC1 family protein
LDIISIGCGGYHSVILSRQGDLYVCGSNQYGQLGLGDNMSRYNFVKVTFNNESIPPFITSFKCGQQHTIIMKENGEVLSVGYNNAGQLGQSNSTPQLPIFQRVGLRKTIML